MTSTPPSGNSDSSEIHLDARLRQFADAAPSGILVVDDSGNIELVNSEAERMFGYRRDELAGQPIEILFPERLRRSHPGYIKSFFPAPEARQMGIGEDLTGVRKDGSEFPLEIGLNPIENNSGVRVLANIVDITERKSMQDSLFEEKERLEVTLHSIGDGVITTDVSGKVDYMNAVAERLTGWSRKEALGIAIEVIFDIVDERTSDLRINPVTECLSKGSIYETGHVVDLISRDGKQYGIRETAAPILKADGTVLGAVLVFKDVTEARKLERQTQYQALHDDLTGLPNRRVLEQRLQEAINSARDHGNQHALCYLDLDNFKLVNDTAGHAVGDKLLQHLAQVLHTPLSSNDCLARLGGDEFGVILENREFETAYAIAERLVTSVNQFNFVWEDNAYDVGVSIGIVPITGGDASVAQLLTQADVACYAAKNNGRGHVVAYDSDDGEPTRRHGEMLQVASLRAALVEDTFSLHGQRIVNLNNAGTESPWFEMLIRLDEANGSHRLPSQFIQAAERYDLMRRIDRWVVQESFRQYDSVFGKHSGTRIGINISGSSLRDNELLEFILKEAKRTKIPPERVCFELTETAAVKNLSTAAQQMMVLKEQGFEFALDDFGSGVSSYSYLRQLPVDYLKIDGNIAANLSNDQISQAMVESIHKVARAIGIRTVAEWVETPESVKILKNIGVDFAQGFAFGHPQPVSDLSRLASWMDSENRVQRIHW